VSDRRIKLFKLSIRHMLGFSGGINSGSYMHILFIIDPLESLAAYKDTSVSMMRALIARGHGISVCEMTDIFVRDGLVLTHSLALDIPQEEDLHSDQCWHY